MFVLSASRDISSRRIAQLALLFFARSFGSKWSLLQEGPQRSGVRIARLIEAHRVSEQKSRDDLRNTNIVITDLCFEELPLSSKTDYLYSNTGQVPVRDEAPA